MPSRIANLLLIVSAAAFPQTPAPKISTYRIADVTKIPVLVQPPGQTFVFRNGIFQTPGLDYQVTPSSGESRIRFAEEHILQGDTIEVVTLPLNILPVANTIVRNERPVRDPKAPGRWKLSHLPLFGAACYRNGLRQTPGADYTVEAQSLISSSWNSRDTINCDYEW